MGRTRNAVCPRGHRGFESHLLRLRLAGASARALGDPCTVCYALDRGESASLEPYNNTLGLEVNSTEGKFADFKLEGTSLALFEKEAASALFPKEHMRKGGGVILAFQVQDLQKTCEELRLKGVEIFEGPKKTPWGQTVAYFKDPDENIWEVSEK